MQYTNNTGSGYYEEEMYEERNVRGEQMYMDQGRRGNVYRPSGRYTRNYGNQNSCGCNSYRPIQPSYRCEDQCREQYRHCLRNCRNRRSTTLERDDWE